MFSLPRCKRCSNDPFKSLPCSGNPFSRLFGEPDSPSRAARNVRNTSDSENLSFFNVGADEELLQFPSAADVETTLANWKFFLHQRAKDFFSDDDAVNKVLKELIQNFPKECDPVLGPADACVEWHGPKETKHGMRPQPVMKVRKPEGEVDAYVNRILVFMFASDESFEEMLKLPKEPFKMTCGNTLCTNMAHLSPTCTLNACSHAVVVTLNVVSNSEDSITISCTSMSGNEIVRLQADPSSILLASVRSSISQALNLPGAAISLVTSAGIAIPKAYDDHTLQLGNFAFSLLTGTA